MIHLVLNRPSTFCGLSRSSVQDRHTRKLADVECRKCLIQFDEVFCRVVNRRTDEDWARVLGIG